MHRMTTNKSTDAAMFRRTAVRTKSINISPKSMRGGTRM